MKFCSICKLGFFGWKNKKDFQVFRNGDLERRGTGSCGTQRPESQELSVDAVPASLITMKCSET
jgi:hypothetical protein